MSNNKILSENYISINNDFAIYFSSLNNSMKLKSPIHLSRQYICFCIGGYAEIEINLIKHTIIKNEIVFISQNMILSCYNISDDFRFFLFSYSRKIQDELFNDLRKYPLYRFFKQKFPSILLNETDNEQIKDYYNLIWKVANDIKNDYRRDIIKSLLCSLLINISWLAKGKIEKPLPVTRKHEITHDFFSLICEHFKEAKNVYFYADKLCVSPKYLSTLIKEVTNKTAKECINNRLILESKFLLNSSYTIQEVSQKLNFQNQSSFGKFFMKHTGMSPINYRKSRLE